MIVVGLGNPGSEYADTRHNAGFVVLEAARQRWRGAGWSKQRLYEETRLRLAGREHRLVRPQTFMNCSGQAVARLLREGVHPDELLVVLDDVDLSLGQLRIRAQGGAGGHKGLQSILDALAPASVARIRVGVGRPENADRSVVDHVLGEFDQEELARFDQMVERTLEAVHLLVRAGVESAMNRFNGLPAPWEGREEGN